MSKVVLLGECMMELSQAGDNLLSKSFAGDVYNTAVYLKRVLAQADVSFLTAAGDDVLSQEFSDVLASEGVGTQYVYSDPARTLGSYMVHLDSDGERSFTYWRSDSAAKQVLKLISDDFVEQIADADYFFYSGISLAILAEEDREKLWPLLEKIRAKGVKVVFDPNYRPKLWVGTEDVVSYFDQAFAHCDLLLPGIEDFDWLYGLSTIDSIKQMLAKFEIPEVIIKNGPKKVTCLINQSELSEVEITPVEKVVDTTSAGDSFNGAFLAAKLQGRDLSEAIQQGALVAGEVIQHKGAIVQKALFSEFIAKAL